MCDCKILIRGLTIPFRSGPRAGPKIIDFLGFSASGRSGTTFLSGRRGPPLRKVVPGPAGGRKTQKIYGLLSDPGSGPKGGVNALLKKAPRGGYVRPRGRGRPRVRDTSGTTDSLFAKVHLLASFLS